MIENIVALAQMHKTIEYPNKTPFFPDQIYPELKNIGIKMSVDKDNGVFATVRSAFIAMGLDKSNIGTPKWNPLSELINKGDMVVIKPNFVLDYNINDETSFSTITHGAVIRAVIDYVILALKENGKIIVADAPQMNCNFDKLLIKNGMKGVAEYYDAQLKSSGISFELIDLRREMTQYKNGVVWKRIPLSGDPRGYTIVDLGDDSEFKGINPDNFYGADYNRKETIAAHSYGHHKYFISNTILQSDVIISMPKLKVHRKVGVTLNLKNMVGINGNKNYLVHYQVGTKSQGGDEFSVESKIAVMDRKVKDKTLGRNWSVGKYLYVIYMGLKKLCGIKDAESIDRAGDWWGNDTTWRMALDLNKVLLYSNKYGKMSDDQQRRYLSVVDGIVGGEGEGPLQPTPVLSGVIFAGRNPVSTDIVAATYMGIDYTKVKSLVKIKKGKKSLKKFDDEDIMVRYNGNQCAKIETMPRNPVKFKAPHGWQDYL